MYITLNVIVRYMDWDSEAYFDIETYECFFENQVKHTTGLLKIPEIDELSIIRSYIESSNDKFMINKFKYHIKVSIHSFHTIVNNLSLEDDWFEFRYNFLLQKAKNWCEDNYIIYTSKQC